MDVDLRKLRYFVAVAECAGFRRASQKLNVAQPALTRQIRSFEGEMEAALFTRTTRGVLLTEAGRQLLEEAEPLLASANAMHRRVADLKSRAPRLTVGFATGIAVASVIRRFSGLYPYVDVNLVSISPDEQAPSTLEGRVDVCFARAPMLGEGLKVVPLFEEPRVVAMPTENPLAHVDYLELRDLDNFQLLQDPETVPEMGRAAGTEHRPTQTGRVPRKFTIATTEEALEHVAALHGIVVMPASAAAVHSRPDVTYRRVNGLLPSAVVLGYAVDRATRHVRSLVDIATGHAETIGFV